MAVTKQQCEEIVLLLSEEFNIKKPSISWHGRTKNGKAAYHKNVIYLGPNMWRGVDCVLHEFAHILHHRTTGERLGRWGARDRHREGFCAALHKVARAWYGNELLYRWDTEYACVKTYIKRRLLANVRIV